MPKEKPTTEGIQLTADHDALRPRFATSVNSRLAADHVLLEFVYHDGNMGALLGRFGISPQHAKRLRDLLDRQIKEYERQFGQITDLPVLEGEVLKRMSAKKKAKKKAKKRVRR